MRLGPNATGWPEGGPPEEARRPHVCCAPPPRPPTWFHRSPVQPKPNRPTPEAAPPAEDSSTPGSGAEATAWSWDEPVERPQLLAIESHGTGADERWAYESMSASSGVSLPPPPAKAASQQRKTRTLFKWEQLQKMEEIFQQKNYLTVSERRQLAASLGMADGQVRTWFQNRRMRFKRELQEHWQSSLPSVPYSSYNPGVPPNFFQDFSMYPQQIMPPFIPSSGLQSGSPCPLYQPPQNPPYPLLAPGLPYDFSPQVLMHADTQGEADCMPSPHFIE